MATVDDVHQFLGRSIGDDDSHSRLDSFELIAKEGRKYGLTLCIAIQRPSDLPPGTLSLVGLMIVYRIADGRHRQMIEKAAAEMDLFSLQFLPGLRQGEAVVMGVDLPVPVSILMNAPTRPPLSDGPDCRRGWGGLSKVAFADPPPISSPDEKVEPDDPDGEIDARSKRSNPRRRASPLASEVSRDGRPTLSMH